MRVVTTELSFGAQVHTQMYNEGCKPFKEAHDKKGALRLSTATTTSTLSPSGVFIYHDPEHRTVFYQL